MPRFVANARVSPAHAYRRRPAWNQSDPPALLLPVQDLGTSGWHLVEYMDPVTRETILLLKYRDDTVHVFRASRWLS